MNKHVGRLLLAALGGLVAAGGAHAEVVISQVYGGGGGTSGPTYRNDYVELHNRGAAPEALAGLSVQYASATGTGTFGGTAVLPAVDLQPGQYFLIRMGGGSVGAELPPADASGSANMSAASGKVVLVRSSTALACNGGSVPCSAAQMALVVDLVGYGTANFFEGSGPAPGLSNTTAALRKGNGAIDSNDNAGDFFAGAPNPRNSGTVAEPPEPPAALTIAQIQGNGPRSVHADRNVVTEGIVTARRFNNGFFLQSANDDGDPATSDAVFVFTGSAPPATAAVGNRVRVTGKVLEFTPASNPHQLSITQIGEPIVDLLESGVALPPPIELTASDLAPTALPGTLERLEAMRVSVAGAVVVGPSDGRVFDSTATSNSDGVMYVTLPDVARPHREAGLPALDITPLPVGTNPPRFDGNPERLMVRSRGQIGAFALSADQGAQLAGLLGVLDYFDGTWALLPDTATPPTVTGGRLPEAVNDAAYEQVTIGGFNLLRFFDEVADNNGAPTVRADALDRRLGKTANAICTYLKTPDILGVVEVENARVLGLLADRIDATCPRAPHYVPYLVPGNDVGGINVGFLVSTRDNGVGMARVEVVEVTQHGKAAVLANPDGSTSLLNDRPPLLLRAIVHQDNGARYPVTAIINHLRSLNDNDSLDPGSNGWATAGERVRAKRGAQAAYLAALVEQLQQANPAEKIVLLGDFNAFEFNDGTTDVMGIVRGDEAGPGEVLNYVDSPIRIPLTDGSRFIADPSERYSYVFGGNAQSLDHVVVNQAMLAEALAIEVDHARINADFGNDNFGDYTVPVRVSDHDPVRLSIGVPAFRSADLSLTATAVNDSVHVGESANFTVEVANAGPNAAEYAAVAFVFEALVAPVVTAPSGWTCVAPWQDGANTTVTCTTPAFASGADATFEISAVAPDSVGGAVLRLAAAVSSQTADRANGDNGAAVDVQVNADADLTAVIAGPAKKLHYGRIETFTVTLASNGPDTAWQPVVVLAGDAPAANVAIDSPQGWQCQVSGSMQDFEARCTHAGAFAAAMQQGFDFRIDIPARPDSTEYLTIEATVSASTPDANPANNSAVFAERIVGVP